MVKWYLWLLPLCIIVKDWKQLVCLSVGHWLNKSWYVHTVEFYEENENIILRQSGQEKMKLGDRKTSTVQKKAKRRRHIKIEKSGQI